MKKGQLLLKQIKKIGLFDLSLLTFFLILAITFFIYFFRKNIYIETTIKVASDNVLYDYHSTPYWFAFSLYPGLKEKDGLGRTQAEVLDVLLLNAVTVTNEEKKTAYLKIKLRTTYNKRKNQYSYRGKAVVVGSPIKLNLNNVMVEGLITNIPTLPDTRENQELTLEARLDEKLEVYPDTYGVPDYIASAFQQGEKSFDSQGNVIAEIIEKKESLADKIVADQYGNVILAKHPLRKNVFLKMKVKTTKINNEFYFLDDVKVGVGKVLPLQLEKITIYPTITKIY